MNRPAIQTCWLPVLLLSAAAPAVSAQATVEFKARSREIFVDEVFEILIEISDFKTCEAPEMPHIPNCTVGQLAGPFDQSERIEFNGRVIRDSRKHTYSCALIPHAVGELVIPPIPVRVDGQMLMTRRATLTVRPSNAEEFFSVEISGVRQRVYVGQRMRLTLIVWVRPPRSVPWTVINVVDYLYRQMDRTRLGPFGTEASRVTQRPRPGGNPAEPFYAYEFDADFAPDRPGQLSFEEIEVGLAYPTRGGYRSVRARPTVAPLEVLPVPMEGRPPDFAGAVGLYDIEVSAAPTNVRVGDPIELTIDIFGEGPLQILPPPLLAAHAQLNADFRVPDEKLAGEVYEARRRFKVIVRARHDEVREIPSIEYPYFDPDAERFVIARSDPIPLTVAPVAEVTAPEPAPDGTPPAAASGAGLQALDGLHDIETSEARLLATTRMIAPGLVAGVTLTPPALFLLTWGGLVYIQRRTGDPARRRRQAALRTARRRVAEAQNRPPRQMAVEIVGALAGYVADRVDQPAARFTGRAALDFFRQRNVSAGLVEQWAAVIACCEEGSFAGDRPVDGAALGTQALKCLAALAREKL